MRQLSNGMWVRTSVGIGIYINEAIAIAPDGSRRMVSGANALSGDEKPSREAWVHLTNPDGTTLTAIPAASCGAISQAAFEDIPQARRPSTEQGALMGYV